MQVKLMYDGKGLTIRPNDAEEAHNMDLDSAWWCDAIDNVKQGMDEESTDPDDMFDLEEVTLREQRLLKLSSIIRDMSKAWGNKI